jgi:galactokinase
VHGGGFAGTIQAFVKTEDVAAFNSIMDASFGDGACMVLNIRPVGAARVF